MEIKHFIPSEQELISFEGEKKKRFCISAGARQDGGRINRKCGPSTRLHRLAGDANVDGAYRRGNQYIFYLLALYVGLQILQGVVTERFFLSCFCF